MISVGVSGFRVSGFQVPGPEVSSFAAGSRLRTLLSRERLTAIDCRNNLAVSAIPVGAGQWQIAATLVGLEQQGLVDV